MSMGRACCYYYASLPFERRNAKRDLAPPAGVAPGETGSTAPPRLRKLSSPASPPFFFGVPTSLKSSLLNGRSPSGLRKEESLRSSLPLSLPFTGVPCGVPEKLAPRELLRLISRDFLGAGGAVRQLRRCPSAQAVNSRSPLWPSAMPHTCALESCRMRTSFPVPVLNSRTVPSRLPTYRDAPLGTTARDVGVQMAPCIFFSWLHAPVSSSPAHTRTVRSCPPVNTTPPAPTAAHSTVPPWPLSVARSGVLLPSLESHTRAVWSELTLTSMFLESSHAMPTTHAVCPTRRSPTSLPSSALRHQMEPPTVPTKTHPSSSPL
mmetsp:Transcript_7682/g.27023  ORF Transcript_7682/g.27023 Transcript_7682/m.27023 type:complete len:320 (+) Transcript_7682:48-1007(+)